jgi:hypothetical protein
MTDRAGDQIICTLRFEGLYPSFGNTNAELGQKMLVHQRLCPRDIAGGL